MTNLKRAAPPVTVALPTIGRMDYLPALIASLEAQTYGDFEALILDNASPPEAQALFAAQAAKDPRFRVVRAEERIPMFTNFNRGWHEMRGKYLVYFHDDDVYMPRFLEKHVEFLDREPAAGFAGSNNDFIDRDGTLTEERRWIPKTEVMPGKRYIEFVMSRGRNLVTMQSIAYRKEALAPKGIDDTLSCHYGDFIVMMRMAETCGVGLLADSLVKVRRHEEQLSVKGWRFSDAFELRASMMRDYCAEYRARWPRDSAFAADLERALRRSIRIGSVWGWLMAGDENDAAACLASLRGSPLDDGLHAMLRTIDGMGLAPNARKKYIAPLVRRVGNALKV